MIHEIFKWLVVVVAVIGALGFCIVYVCIIVWAIVESIGMVKKAQQRLEKLECENLYNKTKNIIENDRNADISKSFPIFMPLPLI